MPLYAVILAVACGAILLLGQLGQLAHRRAQARTAADAAALAGATSGREVADDVAAENGAVLEGYIEHGTDVDVRVRIGSTHANARARRESRCRSSTQPEHLHFLLCQPSNPG
jgi:hypothetical protein